MGRSALKQPFVPLHEILSMSFQPILSTVGYAFEEEYAKSPLSGRPPKTMEKIMKQKIRDILAKHGALPVPVETLSDDADLYAAGLSSFASVQVMLGIEEAFDVEFPDNLLNRKSFQSVDAITRAVSSLVGNAEAAE